MVIHSSLIALIVLLISTGVWSGGYYALGNPQTYEVRRVWQIENRGGAAKNFKAKMLLFNLEEMPPYQKILSYSVSPSGYRIKLVKDYAEFVLPVIASKQSITLEFKYLIVNYTVEYSLDAYSGRSLSDARYLAPESGIESTAPSIVSLAKQLSAGAQSSLEKAKCIFDDVNGRLRYQLTDETAHSALATLNRGYGSCVDFSLLYIALCRAAGIPARYVSGFRLDSSKISGRELKLDEYGHAWVEVLLPRIGWVTVDPTYNYTVNGIKEVNYDFFGKITSEDRHLFVNYSRETDYKSVWEYDPRRPARIQSRIFTTIRRIR